MCAAFRKGCIKGEVLFKQALHGFPSASPAMIWSRVFFCVQSSLQNLQVFASSLGETTKSSNISPSCCTRDVKACRSTDSLICPLTYASMAVIISLALLRCASVSPKFSTMVSGRSLESTLEPASEETQINRHKNGRRSITNTCITSSLHHLSSTLTRPIQFKEFRVHVVFNGFPTEED